MEYVGGGEGGRPVHRPSIARSLPSQAGPAQTTTRTSTLAMFPPIADQQQYLSNARVLQTRNPLSTFEVAQAALKGKGKATFQGDDRT